QLNCRACNLGSLPLDYKLRYTLEALEEELRWKGARSSLFKAHRMRTVALSMAGIPGLFILLVLLCVFMQVSPYTVPWKPTWPAYRLPVVLPQSTLNLAKADFDAKAKLEVSSSCGPQCHKGTPLPTYEEA
ncbi:protease, serine, 23, isoform CRA_c, partial [Mus musculus]